MLLAIYGKSKTDKWYIRINDHRPDIAIDQLNYIQALQQDASFAGGGLDLGLTIARSIMQDAWQLYLDSEVPDK